MVTTAVGLVGCSSTSIPATATTTTVTASDDRSGSSDPSRCTVRSGPVDLALVDESPDVVLRAHRDGSPITLDVFRELQSAGTGSDGYNDVTVDPETLEVLSLAPLGTRTESPDGPEPSFAWSGSPVTFSTAWPTASGYINLMVDIDGPGLWLFELLAAQQSAVRLDALVARSGDDPPDSWERTCSEINAAFAAAAADDPAQRAVAGQTSLDAVTAAWSATLIEIGSNRPGSSGSEAPFQFGVTLDDDAHIADSISALDSAWPRDDSRPWVRLVLDPDRAPADYAPAVRALSDADVRVTGLVIDSSAMAETGVADAADRWRSATRDLPDVDQWEIGNEINGEWLGQDVTRKLADAAGAARSASTPTMLTLYWQLGEADEEHSLFTWIRDNLDDELVSKIDVIGLSIYPEDQPLGPAALERVVGTLRVRFPGAPIVISELGYWSEDLGHRWWWGDRDDPEGSGRLSVMDLYQRGARALDGVSGGAYWWYFIEEMPAGSDLLDAWSAAVGSDI